MSLALNNWAQMSKPDYSITKYYYFDDVFKTYAFITRRDYQESSLTLGYTFCPIFRVNAEFICLSYHFFVILYSNKSPLHI